MNARRLLAAFGWRRSAIAVAILAMLGVWWALASSPGPDPGWVKVERDDLVLSVEITGTLKAVESSRIGPPPSNEIWDFKISFLAPEGAQVKPGQPVLGFDTSELDRKLEEKVAEAEAAAKKIEKKQSDMDLARRQDALQLAEAEARLRKARLQVDVPPELAKAQELWQARQDLEQAEKEIAFVKFRRESRDRADEIALRALRKQRDGAERRVKEIRQAIEDMRVKAPKEGTVVYVSNWRDEKKKVGDRTWRGEKVLEIPDLRKMAAKGEVDEADAGRIVAGQKLSLKLDAHPDVAFKGQVASIWSTVQRRSWQDPQKIVSLEITLDETDTVRMRPGMRFRGEVETERLPRVLVIPSETVFPTPEGPVVYRKTLFGHERVSVKLGRRNPKRVEVIAGLAEGDLVARHEPTPAEGGETGA